MSKKFGVSNRKGLSSVLLGKVPLSEAVLDTRVAGLKVLPSGPSVPNYSELLESAKMRNLLEEVKKDYDMVLFDSSPILYFSDGLILSSMIDAVVFIIEASRIGNREAARLKDILPNLRQCQILGAILNRVERESGRYYYYYYGKYGQKKRKTRRKVIASS